MNYETTWFLDQIWTILAFFIFTFSLYKNKNISLSFIVFLEFALSNYGIHSLINKDNAPAVLDVLVPSTQGLFNILLGSFLCLMYKYGVFSGVSVFVGIVYYLIGVFQFAMVFESIQFEGVEGYPLEFLGLFYASSIFYTAMIVLILFILIVGLRKDDGRGIINKHTMRNTGINLNSVNFSHNKGRIKADETKA